MKKFYITLSALLTFLSFNAEGQADISLDRSIMKQALTYGDNAIATNSLYTIIAKEGPTSTYKDSLAYLYFNSRKYTSCFMVCKDILSRDGNKLEILEMQAISLEGIGAIDQAAQSYAKLTAKSNNNYHAFKLAGLYFGTKKNKEALMAIKKAESLEDTGKINVTFAINKNHNQQVSLKAAIANLKGLIQREMKDTTAAKASFQQAISVQSDFVYAKENLQGIVDAESSTDNK